MGQTIIAPMHRFFISYLTYESNCPPQINQDLLQEKNLILYSYIKAKPH
uniref:Uncharacterized protein n=1 Tax=Anguilla anguilla TaxID=7936 RepID=A0A0E9PYM4_ANGAN